MLKRSCWALRLRCAWRVHRSYIASDAPAENQPHKKRRSDISARPRPMSPIRCKTETRQRYTNHNECQNQCGVVAVRKRPSGMERSKCVFFEISAEWWQCANDRAEWSKTSECLRQCTPASLDALAAISPRNVFFFVAWRR